CLILSFSAQAQVFVIERGSNTSLVFNNIKSAVDALQDNDKLYLPPGSYSLKGYNWEGYAGTNNYSNLLMINKKVSIYGGGCMNGANSTILTDGTLVIGKDANGSLITGIRFDSNFRLDNVSNCIVSRCTMNGTSYFYGAGNNNIITECEFYDIYSNDSGYLSSVGNGLSCIFSKCIFRNWYRLRGATVYNCIFKKSPDYSYYYYDNSTLRNNIYMVSTSVTNANITVYGTNNSYSNNLWVGGYPSTNASDNNSFNNEIIREPYANVFVDYSSGDYHLQDICSGKNAGNDGTDVGIYGTNVPFKENRLPLTPNFSLISISPETDATGKLPVNIIVEAQDR
ncbi:hypothetical protein LJB98_05250, partial [Bacteroidales bacterium OttesenSCG-928-M11]|nr:hypothetical protein [Bacteroidales bacterium OttesenSCG-928-M11]